MQKCHVSKLILLVIGVSAALVTADLLLFAYGTFDACSLALSNASPSDIKWWARRVGAVPNSPEHIQQPQAMSGRNGTWYHRNGGSGAQGASGYPVEAESGIAAFDMQYDYALVRGRALATNEQCAYHVGVGLPFVFLERWYVGPANTDPGHPAEDWRKTFHFGYFALNVLVGVLVIDVCLVWFHRARGWQRCKRGRCPECAHVVLPAQTHCPECGEKSGGFKTA